MNPVDAWVAICGVLSVAWFVVRYRRASRVIDASRSLLDDDRSAD